MGLGPRRARIRHRKVTAKFLHVLLSLPGLQPPHAELENVRQAAIDRPGGDKERPLPDLPLPIGNDRPPDNEYDDDLSDGGHHQQATPTRRGLCLNPIYLSQTSNGPTWDAAAPTDIISSR